MAWRYSKRVKVAPGVFMNISKNGINTSIGVRGASMTFGNNGTYLNTGIPGTGFYNRKRIGVSSVPKVRYSQPASTPSIHSKGAYTFTGILCAFAAFVCLPFAPIGLIGTIIFAAGTWANFSNRKKYYGKKFDGKNESPSFIADAKQALATSTDDRHKRILTNFITTIETIDSIEDEELIIAKLSKKPRKNADLIDSHTAELNSLRMKLDATEYNADSSVSPQELSLYENMCQSFESLLTAQKIWLQISRTQNIENKSSAATLVNRKEINLGVGVFNYIKTIYDVPVLPFGSLLLYLYPEFAILSQTPSKFDIIDYKNISVVYSSLRFNEPSIFPTDAEKIGSTWQYVNKNGTPDKRYSNNRQVAVVKYGVINVTIKGYQSVVFHVSNAVSADRFCTNFNRFAVNFDPKNISVEEQDNTPDLPPSICLSGESSEYSLADVINASDKLFNSLISMSANKQVLEALDNQRQLDQAKEIKIGGDKIDSRLGFLAVSDLIKCFEGLGHRAEMSTDEGRAIGIILSRILLPDNDIWNDEEMLRSPKGQQVLTDAYKVFKNNLHVEFDPNKFLLVEMLRHEGVDDEIVRNWAILLYRYAMLIARADGRLSDTEQKWLTNILTFTQNGGVSITKFNSTSKTISLPADVDSLFVDVAKFVVSSNIASTSSIQRRFGLGYNRAGKIMDQLEMAGIVGPAKGAQPREVLMDSLSLDEFLRDGRTSVDSIEDIDPLPITKPKKSSSKSISNPLDELENLIGLSGVKTEIENIYNFAKIQKVRTAKGLNSPDISYHCVFTGNPGTGKTTVARLVAQIYTKLGILSKGHLVETDRSGLVAEYVGQTAVKTNKIIDTALDGVLFIDEAYSLVQNGGGNDFGSEAISTLLKRMEDNRDRLVVILAGYSEEMKQFIDSNPGLQSRFNRYIHFEDYSAEELIHIYKFNLSKFDYRMTEQAEAAVHNVMTEAVANKDKNFGNARFVRNLFEKTLERQAKRLASSSLSSLNEDTLTEIKAEDIM